MRIEHPPSLAPGPAPRASALPIALAALWLALPAGAPLAPRIALATAEEFSSFGVETREEDDESLLDHLLTRTPREWRAEWERAPQAFRTSQGCLTSGQWFIVNDLKLRTPIGSRSSFDLELLQSHDDTETFEYLRLGFHRAIPHGSVGLAFAPTYDKSKQDFTFSWEVGADTSALQIQTRLTIEDAFNNLWEFRQSRAGQASEPYLRHPFEPEIRVVSRHDGMRFEAGGRWLTAGTKRIEGRYGTPPFRIQTLWGALGYAAIEVKALGLEWEARTSDKQADGSDRPDSLATGDFHDFRRLWSTEISARRPIGERYAVLGRWLYQGRTQRYGAGAGAGAFEGVDRLTQIEFSGRAGTRFNFRVGGIYDRITIAQSGLARSFSFGSRKESRIYLALIARFGRLSVQGVEGIELDREPYTVTLHHDKGFLQLQTTF